jgi:ABC-type branched-subunit amino acid transport system permease subunit
VTLALLPFALAQAGTSWVRITNLAILYTLLALGLNIVVGFAGLLDLGYIAFYAVGAWAPMPTRSSRAPTSGCICPSGRSCRSAPASPRFSASSWARPRSSCAATTSPS